MFSKLNSSLSFCGILDFIIYSQTRHFFDRYSPFLNLKVSQISWKLSLYLILSVLHSHQVFHSYSSHDIKKHTLDDLIYTALGQLLSFANAISQCHLIGLESDCYYGLLTLPFSIESNQRPLHAVLFKNYLISFNLLSMSLPA